MSGVGLGKERGWGGEGQDEESEGNNGQKYSNRRIHIHFPLLFFAITVFGPILGGFLAGVVMVACFPDDDVQQEEGVL